MLMKQYAWEFDPHGTNPNNYITGERHTLTPDSGKGFHFFIPKAAPFFLKDLEVVHVGTGRKLLEGIDWQPGWMFELASRRTYMPVFAAITILDKTLNGTFEIKYRTIGGEYTLDDATLLEYLSNVLTDPRVTTWEAIVDKPLFFAPLEHRFNVDQLVGMEDAIEALDRIRDAILQSINAIYPSFNVHLADKSNPHAVTKEQVGLGNVQNYPMATDAEAAAGTARNRMMSPAATKALVATLSSETVAGHASNTSNPHQVTKAQVGLGNVDNYKTATLAEALQGTATNLFITVQGAAELVKKLAVGDFTTHIEDKNNPHATTKTHVGLGNVDNFRTATNADADAGSSATTFTTVAIVKRMLDRFIITPFNSHVGNRNNPHAVTKDQVGLSDVENYPVANDAELLEGSAANRYTSVLGVKKMIDKFGVSGLDAHLNDRNNPHGVTKAQVGLGNVQNFSVAGDNDLDTGTANNLYVTVAGVARMIAGIVGGNISDHINNRNNPHGTTKAHVGLGNVDNYATGSNAEADAGTATDKFGTIAIIKRMIDRFAFTPLTTHINDKANPHEVTKAQVGLGNVNNYATASDAQAKAGTATNLHITPANLKSVFEDKLPGLGLGTVVTRFLLPVNGTGGVGWYAIAQQLQEDTSAGRYLIYGLTNSNRPVEVVVRYDQANPLFVIEESGAVLQAKLGTTFDAANGIVKLWVNPNPQVGEVLAVKVGGGGAFLLEGWKTAEPAGITYAATDSTTLRLRAEAMWADFYMAQSFAAAVDLMECVRPVDLAVIDLDGQMTDLTDDTKRLFRWSTTLNVVTGQKNRMELAGFETYGGTIKVSLNGTNKLTETIERPTSYLGYVDLLEGSNAVIVEVECPLLVQPPQFVDATVKHQNVKKTA